MNIAIGHRETYGGSRAPFDIPCCDRLRHLLVLGQSGTGKSTFLANSVIQDIYGGAGITLIDPHGDLSEEVLAAVPPERVSDVLYFNPADREHPIGFNPLAGVPEERHPQVASDVVEALHSIWADSWGPRLENLLMQSLRAVMYRQDATLLSVSKMLTSAYFRAQTLPKVRDLVVSSFWIDQFETWPARYQSDAIAPVMNKLDRLNSNPLIRNIIGQVKPSFKPRFVMDNRKIVIANLSRGAIGVEASSLLGSLLVSSYGSAAFTRHSQAVGERVPHNVVVDEAHSFVSDTFARLLSEARKYALSLTLATQFIGQLRPSVATAIFGNTGNLIVFRTSSADSEALSREFNYEVSASSITGLPAYNAYVRTASMSTPVPSRVHTLKPLAETPQLRHGRKPSVVRRTRAQFARPRLLVERKIDRFLRS